MAPPMETEADRLFLESLARGRARANAALVSRGREPLPEPEPSVYPPGHKLTIFEQMAELNKGRDRVAAAKRKRDAEREKAKLDAEALTAVDSGTDVAAVSSDSAVSPPCT